MSQGLKVRSLRTVLYLAVVVLINVVGLSQYVRVDLTEDKMYSLSEVSKQAVSSLAEPLTIKAFFSKDLPPPYNTTERYLRDLLSEYGLHANTNFNYSFYDVSPENPENQNLAQSFGIRPVQVQVVQEDELKYKNAYMGLVLIHGDAVEKLPTISSTSGLEYKLTSTMEKLKNKVSALLNLEEPVQVTLYLSPSLQKVAPHVGLDELSSLPDRLSSITEDLNKENYGKIEYDFVDLSTRENFSQIVERYDLQALEWPAFDTAGLEAGQGAIGLVLEHEGEHRTLSLLNIFQLPLLGTQYNLVGQSQLEELINSNLQTMLGINQDLGYLASHGTPSINRMTRSSRSDQLSLQAFKALTSETYNLKEVTLGQGGIPEGLGSLVMAGPEEAFSEYELYQIDQALMRGTNLAVFLDSFSQKTTPQQQRMGRPPQYEPNRTGLEKLLNHYGLDLEEAIVLDENCFKQQLPQSRGGGQQPIYFAPIIQNQNINHDLPFMNNIKGLVTLKNGPVKLRESVLEEQGLNGQALFSSSEKSWTMSGRINLNPMLISPPSSDDEQFSRPLAAMVEGEFTSFFKGKPIPEKETEDQAAQESNGTEVTPEAELQSKMAASGTRLDQGRPAKIVLIGSSALLSDQVLDAEGQSPNSAFVMNIMDALNGRQAMASLRSKVQQFNPLNETSSATKAAIKSTNIIGLPILVVLTGLIVLVRRSSRKRQIKQMFE